MKDIELPPDATMKNQETLCCEASIYGKGDNQGLWCSKCNKEVFNTRYKELNKRTGEYE